MVLETEIQALGMFVATGVIFAFRLKQPELCSVLLDIS